MAKRMNRKKGLGYIDDKYKEGGLRLPSIFWSWQVDDEEKEKKDGEVNQQYLYMWMCMTKKRKGAI